MGPSIDVSVWMKKISLLLFVVCSLLCQFEWRWRSCCFMCSLVSVWMKKTFLLFYEFNCVTLNEEDFLIVLCVPLCQSEWRLIDFLCVNSTFSNIMVTCFSGGGSWSTRRDPSTLGKQLVNFITCGYESIAPFFVIYKAGHEPMLYWW